MISGTGIGRTPKEQSSTFTTVLLVLLASLGMSTSTFAQCEDGRYRDPIFSSSRTASNIIYSNAPALAGLCNLEFLTANYNYGLDIYEPVGDTLSERPCIVFAHGGAFAIGDKRMAPVEDFCYAMADRGYVVASIDYRKCFNALSASSPVRAVYRAVQDMRAAIRYVKANAATYGIDTNLVFAGGNSAGGFMALHAAYADESERAADLPETYSFPDLGCLDCTGNSYTTSGKPAGVLNLWGAIFDTDWMEPGDAPLISFHGTADLIVYNTVWPPFSWPLFPPVYGSAPIHSHALSLGINTEYHEFPGEGHEPWLLSISSAYYFDFIVDKSSNFLYNNFLTPPDCCPTPQGLAVTGLTANSATLEWNDMTNALSYDLQGRRVGGGANNLNVSSSDFPINILEPATTYQWRVRTVCSTTPTGYSPSDYSVVSTFTTPSLKPELKMVEEESKTRHTINH